jgi:hypothetical protein
MLFLGQISVEAIQLKNLSTDDDDGSISSLSQQLGDKIDDLKDEAADKKGEKPADTDKKVSAE